DGSGALGADLRTQLLIEAPIDQRAIAERVVELARQRRARFMVGIGHDDDRSGAELAPKGFLDSGEVPFSFSRGMPLSWARRSADFDVLHFHIDILHFPLFREIAAATLTTLHGRQDLPDLPPLYRAFSEMPLVSISHAQRRPLPPLNWVATVHHGLPRDLYDF